MNIRTRLTINFTLIVATLAILFSVAIYYFSASYRKNDFYERLKEKAKNYAQLIIKLDTLDPSLIQLIDKNTEYLANEKIIVVDNSYHELFSTKPGEFTPRRSFIDSVKANRELRYRINEDEALAIVYPHERNNLVVVVSAHDSEGLHKLVNLRIILLSGLFIFCSITLISGWLFSRQVLNPISGVIKEVENIHASNLQKRVNTGNGKDEIARLALTFNNMLERIEKAFELQKNFVSGSSHELRTPLTSITGQIEVSLMKDRTTAEYKEVLISLLDDMRNLNRLANALLELAQADLDRSKLNMQKVRIDELLWQCRNELLKRHKQYAVNINIAEFPEDENSLTVDGNEQLLRSAFINLMDNACKFSPDHTATVIFNASGKEIHIDFINDIKSKTLEDVEYIGRPFYRGANSSGIEGYGLGLSLVHKIADLHGCTLKIVNENGSLIVSFSFHKD
jgi:signal transduction histidine kinase